MIYAFLADGFEDVEAIGFVDVCRRALLPITTVSTMTTEVVETSHGVKVIADTMLKDNDYTNADMLFIPGGSHKMNDCTELKDIITTHYQAGKPIAAICAAPMILGNLGLLKGKRATCYPGFEQYLTGADYTAAFTERDGQFFTGKGPAAALQLGYDVVRHFCGDDVANSVRNAMMYNYLFEDEKGNRE